MSTRRLYVLLILIVTVGAYPLRADVRTEQKTRVQLGGILGGVVNLFGGRAAREGTTSTVAVKGDRKASIGESTGQIIDLTEEKIYDLDVRRKTYKVTTFAELRRRMEEARKKAEEQARKDQGREKKPSEARDSGKEMEIDVDVKDTGQKKTINGFETHQVIMTITVREKGRKVEDSGGLVLTSDMWMTPTIAAMKEIGEFDRRYAQKLQGPMMAGASAEEMATMMAALPAIKDAFGKLNVEGAKMDGTAIMTTVTVDSVKSADEAAQESKANDDSKGTVGGVLGGLARRAQRRPAGDDKRSNVMTSTAEVLKVATTVAPTDVAVPMGFREDR